ncbi:MAG: hypothetical protein EOP70_07570 [Variovorax sp.]|nr:MAG: hypothetical protein EOP70_07570 [Variovorax sp.]
MPGAMTVVIHYPNGDALRSRSVGMVVLHGTLDLPAPPARLTAEWRRDTSALLGPEPGDVEQLSLARTRLRWPGLRHCVRATAEWTASMGLGTVLESADIALMTCRGARYHHDGAQYGASAFCNLFLSDDAGLDLHFPQLDLRIALVRGTVVVFDTGQPHAVVERGRDVFDAADFPAQRDCDQVFLTWELQIEQAQVAAALRVAFDVDGAVVAGGVGGLDAQVRLDGVASEVCAASGRWRPMAS